MALRIGESSYSVCPSVYDAQRGVHPSVKNMVVLSGAQMQGPFAQLDGRRGRAGQGHTELRLVTMWVDGYCRISEAPGSLSLPSSTLLLLHCLLMVEYSWKFRLLIWSRFPIIFMNIKEMIVLIKLTVLSGNIYISVDTHSWSIIIFDF